MAPVRDPSPVDPGSLLQGLSPHLDSGWVSPQLCLHPAWEWGDAAALCSLSPPGQLQSVLHFCVYRQIQFAKRKANGAKPHTWSKKCQSWGEPGSFSAAVLPQALPYPQIRAG